MRRATVILWAALVAGALAPAASAHKFHASLAEIDYDATERTVEISARVFADDLEDAIGRKLGKPVRLESTPDAERLVFDYVRDNLTLESADARPLALTWVGMEVRVDEVWIYVEAKSPDGLKNAKIGDRVFFELFDDQVNTVNVRDGAARATLVFRRGEGPRAVELARP
jgi:hypothetical protein